MEQLFDKFSDQAALEAEKKKILGIFGEIKSGISELSQLGVKIEAGKSIRETSAAVKEYQNSLAKLKSSQNDYALSEEKIIELKIKESKATELAARAAAAEQKVSNEVTKGKILEAQERLKNAQAADKEAKAIAAASKATNTGSNVPVNNSSITQQLDDKTAALRRQKQAEEDLEIAEGKRLAKEQELRRQTGVSPLESGVNTGAAQAQPKIVSPVIDSAPVTKYKDELEKLTDTLENNQQTQRLYQNQIKDIGRELTLLDKTTDSAGKQSASYRTKVANLTDEQNKLKLASKDLGGTIKNQIIDSKSASGSIDQLRARYALLLREIERGGTAFKSSGPGKIISAEIVTVKTALDKAEREALLFRGSLSNTGSAITGFASKAFGAVRKLAYILPGVGIAGIFSLLFDGLGNLISSLGIFNSKISETEKLRRILLEVDKQAAESAGKEAGHLKVLRAEIESTEVPMKKRLQGIKDLKELYPDYFKNLTNEQILTGNVGNAYNFAAAAILRKARANAAAAEIEKLAAVKLAAELKSIQDATDTNKRLSEAKGLKGSSQFGGAGSVSATEQKKIIVEEFNRRKAADQKLIDEANKKQNVLLKIAVAGKGEEIKIDKIKPERKQKDDLDLIFKNEEERRKVLFEVQKRIIQDNIDADNITISNDKNTYEERLAALRDFYDQSLLLIKLQEKFDNGDLDAQQKEEERKARKDVKNKQKLQNLLISIDEEYAAKRQLVEVNTNSAIEKLNYDNTKKKIDLEKQETDRIIKANDEGEKLLQQHQKSIHEDTLSEIKTGYDADIVALDQKFSKGLVKEKDYTKKRLLLQLQSQLELLKADIEFTKETIQLAAARALISGKQEDIDAVVNAQKKLAALQIQLIQTVSDFQLKKGKQSKEEIQKTIEVVAGYANNLLSIIGGFTDAAAAKEQAVIQGQIDDLEKKKQKEIDVATSSIRNADQRAAAIDRIEKVYAAKRQALEDKQKQSQLQQARFQKAASIASIILNTAVAVSKFISTGNIFQAIAAGVLGAAQLAIAIATPLPKFARGKTKGEKYSGPGIIAEKGREMHVDRYGVLRLYSKPAVIDVHRDDIIHSNRVTEDILKANSSSVGKRQIVAMATNNTTQFDDSRIYTELRKLNDKPSGIVIKNQSGIKSSAWYIKHMKR